LICTVESLASLEVQLVHAVGALAANPHAAHTLSEGNDAFRRLWHWAIGRRVAVRLLPDALRLK